MSKKVQSSTGLEMPVGVDTRSKEKPAQKTKAAKTGERSGAVGKPKSVGKTEELKAPGKRTAVKKPKPPTESAAAKERKPSSTKKATTFASSAKPVQPERDLPEDDELHERRKSVKTPQVLKLVERFGNVNPVILAGKSRVPSQLRGKQPLSVLMRREMGEIFSDVDDTVVVNITELAIEHEAPEILDRFNACSCDKCVEVFSRIIAQRVPVRFARVNKNGRGAGSRELSERIAPMRKMVITEMIKELICSKKRCFHDGTE